MGYKELDMTYQLSMHASERSQSEKVTYSVIPTIWHLENAKLYDSKSIWVPGIHLGRGGMNRQRREDF